MRKTYLILFASLAVFVATFELCMHYIEREMEKDAFQLNSQIITNLQLDLDSRLTWTNNGEIRDPQRLRNYLTRKLPYGEEYSFILLVDSVNNNVLLSTDPYYEQFSTLRALRHHEGRNFHREEDLSTSVRHYINKYDGKTFHDYSIRLKSVPWKIIIICDSSAIFEHATQLRHLLWFICGIGLVLLLFCGWLVGRHVRQHYVQKELANKELRMAAKVQMSILKPTEYTAADCRLKAFIKPAKEAGGDLYDYVERDGKFIFCIGDISGKGMTAALFMTQVVAHFRNTVRYTQDPGKIVTQMNEVIAPNNPDMTFCTFIVATLDHGNLSVCNAGHNRPVFIPHDAAGKPSYVAFKPNVAMGVVEDYCYEDETFNLNPGDAFVLYTDGVTEAMDPQKHQFGDAQLLAAIANDSAIDAIVQAIRRHTARAEQSDDITIVKVEYGNRLSTDNVNSN